MNKLSNMENSWAQSRLEGTNTNSPNHDLPKLILRQAQDEG